MSAANRISLPQERYTWALNRAGVTLDDYQTSHPQIAVTEWINGEKTPTINQLEAFAKSVNVPFGYLFLETPPQESIPFPVFRGEAGRYDHFDLNVYDTVNLIRQRQEWLEDYLLENEIDVCAFVGSVTLSTPVEETVNILRTHLNLDARWAFNLATPDAAVNKMTELLEEAGVFVCYNGIVGNNVYRRLEVSECRGFALVSQSAPYIFVNTQDSKSAQLFTLAHEVAHLILGVSAGHAAANSVCHEAEEFYCDSVAAELLVPANELRDVWNDDVKSASRRFKVSELVIARRAHDLHLMTTAAYRSFWAEYNSRPVQNRKSGSGGSFYMTSTKRVGRSFAIHVRNAVDSQQLSYTQAYRLTGLHGRTYEQFMTNNV